MTKESNARAEPAKSPTAAFAVAPFAAGHYIQANRRMIREMAPANRRDVSGDEPTASTLT